MAESKKDTTKAAADAEKAPKKAAAKSTTAKADAPAKEPAAKKAAAKSDSKTSESKASAAKSESKASASKSEAKASGARSSSKAATSAKESSTRKSSGQATTEGAGGTLKVHHLRPAPGAHTAKTRVGRGEASKGKTAGRGTKGTKARYQVPERFEGGQMPLHMRLPKLRGFKNPFRTEYQVVNLDTLAALYPSGGDVTVEDLVAKGAVRKGHPVKVLGNGDVSVKLTVQVEKVSASAREKILAAGGQISQD